MIETAGHSGVDHAAGPTRSADAQFAVVREQDARNVDPAKIWCMGGIRKRDGSGGDGPEPQTANVVHPIIEPVRIGSPADQIPLVGRIILELHGLIYYQLISFLSHRDSKFRVP